ncbi:MAG: hypothetical protein ACE5PV_13060 [Candidatus Poribacteria bacterium]
MSAYTLLSKTFHRTAKKLSMLEGKIIKENLIIEATFHIVESWTTRHDFEPYINKFEIPQDGFEVNIDHVLYHINGAKRTLRKILRQVGLYPPAMSKLPCGDDKFIRTDNEIQRAFSAICWGLKEFQTTLLPPAENPKLRIVESSPDKIIQRLYLLAEYISIRLRELKYQLKKIWAKNSIDIWDEREHHEDY